MPSLSSALHTGTPAITAHFRGLSCLRHPDAPDGEIRLLVTRTQADPLKRTSRTYDARPLVSTSDKPVADAVTVSALSGQPLSLHAADGDTSLTLTDAAGRPLWSRNAQGTVTLVQNEAPEDGGRSVSLTEAGSAADGRLREWYEYAPAVGESAVVWQARNLAGTMPVQYDNGGLRRSLSASITGQPLMSEQRLLTPSVTEPDWATLTEADMEAALTVTGTYDAAGTPLAVTSADGVTTVTSCDIRGAVRETRLRRADGVVLSQTAGNGVTDTRARSASPVT